MTSAPMRPIISSIIITLGLGCGHAAPPAPADIGAIAAEDQVDQADRNHDGIVDASEQAAADQARAADLVRRLDRDGDQRLSLAEAQAATGDDATVLGAFTSHATAGAHDLTLDDVQALVATHVGSGDEPATSPARHAGRGHAPRRGGGGGGGERGGAGSLGDPDSPM